MSEHEKAEIGARLTLDETATEVLHKVKEGFEGVREKVLETQHELIGFAKQAAATFVGFNFMDGLDSMKEFGHEIVNASEEAKAQEKALAGVLLLTDKQGKSMAELKEQAHGIKEEFEEMGMKTGASADELAESFAQIAERSNKSTSEVKEFTQQLFYASKAVSGGMGALSQGFTMIEMGNVRASNAVVKLIAAQHMLKGNAREVAKEMQKMTPEDRLKLAEMAVERMSAKMKPGAGMDLPYKGVLSALSQIREQLFETIGNPVVDALSHQLNRIHQYFLQNWQTVEHWAHVVGDKVGQWINTAADKMKAGFEYLQTHAEEIKDAIVSAWTYAKDVMSFIIDHKEALALLYGGSKMVQGGMGVYSAAKTAVDAAGGLAGFGTGILASGAMVALLAAAMTAWGLAADQLVKLWKETDGFKSDEERDKGAQMDALKRTSDNRYGAMGKDEIEQFDRLRASVVAHAAALGEDTAATGAAVDAIWAHHMAQRAVGEQLEGDAKKGDSTDWRKVFDEAKTNHNTALAQYAADVIAGSKHLQEVFLAMKDNVEGGFAGLADMVEKKDAAFAGQLRALDKAEKKGPPIYNFNGGQTYNIKQDFRDEDPDRVALVFRRDIMRHTENRVQSSFAMVRGM